MALHNKPASRGKHVFLKEPITQQPTNTLTHTHKVTTAWVWIQSGLFYQQANPLVLNLHTLS